MKTGIVGILASCFIMFGCKKDLISCDGVYSLAHPVVTSHPEGVLKLGDTLRLQFVLPFRTFNRATGDTADISRHDFIYQRIWVMQLVRDAYHPSGFTTVFVPNDFRYLSSSVAVQSLFHLKTHRGIQFYMKKAANAFVADVSVIPTKRGVFTLNLRDGVMEKVVCGGIVDSYWERHVVAKSVDVLETFIERPLSDTIRPTYLRANFNYRIRVE